MGKVAITTVIDKSNHIQNQYEYEKIFVRFPQDLRYLTVANATGEDVTLAAGSLLGITTADQTIGKVVASAATDGSQKPMVLVAYDIVIPATNSISVLVGYDGSIYESEVGLDGSDTLDTVITEEGQSIRNSLLDHNSNITIVNDAVEQSDYMNEQV